MREVGSKARLKASGKMVRILEVFPANGTIGRPYTMYVVRYLSGKFSTDRVRVAEVQLV
jgi:hypothetical protein